MHTAEVIYELIVIGFSIDRNLSVWIFQNYQNVIKLINISNIDFFSMNVRVIPISINSEGSKLGQENPDY